MLVQRTPLRRKTRLKAKRTTPRRSERVRDPEYLRAVKRLPCCLALLGDCEGPIEADHVGQRPLGRKCNDDETIPLCRKHHRQRTDASGSFTKITRDEMRAWCGAWVVQTRAALGRGKEPACATSFL